MLPGCMRALTKGSGNLLDIRYQSNEKLGLITGIPFTFIKAKKIVLTSNVSMTEPEAQERINSKPALSGSLYYRKSLAMSLRCKNSLLAACMLMLVSSIAQLMTEESKDQRSGLEQL